MPAPCTSQHASASVLGATTPRTAAPPLAPVSCVTSGLAGRLSWALHDNRQQRMPIRTQPESRKRLSPQCSQPRAPHPTELSQQSFNSYVWGLAVCGSQVWLSPPSPSRSPDFEVAPGGGQGGAAERVAVLLEQQRSHLRQVRVEGRVGGVGGVRLRWARAFGRRDARRGMVAEARGQARPSLPRAGLSASSPLPSLPAAAARCCRPQTSGRCRGRCAAPPGG